MAVLALPAVGGKFGVRGGGYSMSNSASWNIDRPWIGAHEPDTRVVNMNHLGRALTEYDDPPVNVLFVYNCNPAATVPDQRRVIRGLEREDLFTVVFEQVMTDTALYADVVLPATTFLEGYDFAKAYGPINLELGAAGHRRRRRSALERRRVRRAVRAARAAERRRSRPASWICWCACSTRCPARSATSCARARGRRRRSATRRFSSSTSFPNTPDRKVDLFPAALDAERADGPLSVPAGSGDRALSAGAHLAGQRSHDQLDARRAAAAGRQAARCIPTMRRRAAWRTTIWCGSSTSSARCTAR